MRSVSRILTCLFAFGCWPATVGWSQTAVNTGMPWNVHYQRSYDEVPAWSLWETTSRQDTPLDLGGWLSGGFTANAHGNRTGRGNSPLPFNQVADGPVLNQLWLYAAKPLDMESNDFDWGLRIDYVFGADATEMQASGDQGWDHDWNTSRDYGSALPQLYAELGCHEFILRVGYKFGLQGYEAAQAVDNFFYSHTYAFGYGLPGTFSGAAVTYSVTDRLDVIGGWTTGWDSWWSNYLSASTFMGGMSWQALDRTSLTYHVTVGDFGDGTAKNGASSNAGNIYAHALVLTHHFSEHIEGVFENTLGSNTGIGTDNNQWYSLTGYLFVDLTSQWSVGTRLEWFRDEDGRRVGVNGAQLGSYYDATLGLNWYPNANLSVRPELRWDWFSGIGQPFDSRDGMSGTEVRQFTGGVDAVFIF